VSQNTCRHELKCSDGCWKNILVLREWSCGFEARSVATSLSGGSAGSFPCDLLLRECSGECRAELQPPKLGWSGRFDSSWAYALWHERGHPGFVHPRRRCKWIPRRMPTGLQVRRPRLCWGRRVFNSLRICSWTDVWPSKRLVPPCRRGLQQTPGECRQDYMERAICRKVERSDVRNIPVPVTERVAQEKCPAIRCRLGRCV
jgi:hypothetical protein